MARMKKEITEILKESESKNAVIEKETEIEIDSIFAYSNMQSTFKNNGLVTSITQKGKYLDTPIKDYKFEKSLRTKLGRPIEQKDGSLLEYTYSKSPLVNQYHLQTYILDGYDDIDGQKVERRTKPFLHYLTNDLFLSSLKSSLFKEISFGGDISDNSLLNHIKMTYNEDLDDSGAKESDMITLAVMFYFYRNFEKLVEFQGNILPKTTDSKHEKLRVSNIVKSLMFKFKYGVTFFTLDDICYCPFNVDFSNDNECLKLIPIDLKESLGI
jgi:hypothetical protein